MQDRDVTPDPNRMPAAPPPTRSRRGLVVGAIAVLVIAAGSGFVAMIGGFMKSSDAYTDAMARASGDCRVTQALGSPVEPGFFVSGSVETSGPVGHAELSIPVEGPTASGTLYVVSDRSAGVWSPRALQLEMEDASRIDLLAPAACGPTHAAQASTDPGLTPAAGKGAAVPEPAPIVAQPLPEPGQTAAPAGKDLVPGSTVPAGTKQ